MLSLVHHNVLTNETHAVSLSRLMHYLANTKDTSSIKQKLLAMKQHDATLRYAFKNIIIRQNIVYFEYPEHLRSYLAHQRVQAITRQLIDVHFKSKYAFYIYELFLHLNQSNEQLEISVEELRSYLGLTDHQYAHVTSLKHHIIQKSIDQINELTSLHIGLATKNHNEQTSFIFSMCNPVDPIIHLKQLHGSYLADKAYALYSSLPQPVKKKLDQEYDLWIMHVHDYHTHILHDHIKRAFLIQKLVSPLEQDFELWSLSQGYR